MRILSLLFAAAFGLTAPAPLTAQETAAAPVQPDTLWKYGAGLGLDLAGMGLLNPRVGAGASRFGLGGLGTLFANRKAAYSFWNNSAGLQLSAQRLGRTDASRPGGFQKNLDVLQLNSRYGLRLGSDKWFAALDATARTQLLKTYASNFLEPVDAEDRVVSKFLAPLQATLSPGIDYKPNAHLSLFYSPVAIQYILVNDDAIARTNIFGNDPGKNSFFGLGSELKAAYANKYFADRLSVTSALRLFSNYLEQPQNVDVLFGNNFSILLFKGLSLDLLGELLYDHDVLVQKDVNDDGIYNVVVNPDGTTSGDDRLGRGAQMTGAFLLKYSIIF
jgi:hypothetical protein